MANTDDRSQIIIKKVKKGGHGGHHGGAWKIAYADFVTAMMAFFLLMWLLNATTEVQKLGIADYFAPSLVTGSSRGSDGVLGGNTITVDGALKNDTSPIGITIALPSADENWEGESIGKKGGDGGQDQRGNPETQKGPGQGGGEEQLVVIEPDQKTIDALLEQQEQEQFAKTEERLLQALEEDPELKELKDNLVIDQTPEGMRIQIVDRNKTAMFPSGSANMFEHTKDLIAKVVQAISELDNKIAIKGHTDAQPFKGHNGYSNWELSTDRANASRRALLEGGLDPSRIDSVVGRAAQDPFVEDDPFSPQNRRISIILLRDKPLVNIPEFEDGNG